MTNYGYGHNSPIIEVMTHFLSGRLKILRWNCAGYTTMRRMRLIDNRLISLTLRGRPLNEHSILSDFFQIMKIMQNKKSKSKSFNESSQALVQQLLECAIACEYCAASCLNEENVDMMARCIELDRDCADTCFHTAKLITRGSEISDVILAACEKICRICADECKKHDTEHCQVCAETCERCADACHEHHGNLQLH
jgi:hypothetical protein